MTTRRNILAFMGTRPEAVKLAPVVAALRGNEDFRCTVVATGQHKEMFSQVAETFGFTVDADLDVMRPNQTLAGLTARLMDGIDGWLGSAQPDMALVPCFERGDTSCVIVKCCALKGALEKAQAAFVGVIDGYTLSDLVRPRRRMWESLSLQPRAGAAVP